MAEALYCGHVSINIVHLPSASLNAVASWIIVNLSARIERERQARRTRRRGLHY